MVINLDNGRGDGGKKLMAEEMVVINLDNGRGDSGNQSSVWVVTDLPAQITEMRYFLLARNFIGP